MIVISIYEAAIDWGEYESERRTPNDVPYFCDIYADINGKQIEAVQSIIYPIFENGEFSRWDLKSISLLNQDFRVFEDDETIEDAYFIPNTQI